jgi:cytidylate kinase
VLDAGGDPSDPVQAEAAAKSLLPADLERNDLRGPHADAAAAAVASISGVRASLLAFQRQFGAERGAVLDGRDIGTVIFPNAPVKLFVTASLAERGRRRWLELQQKGIEADPAKVEADMADRDAKDAARAAAPLRAAADAFTLDTSGIDPDTVFETALTYVRQRIPQA